jgi:hypothetical protein
VTCLVSNVFTTNIVVVLYSTNLSSSPPTVVNATNGVSRPKIYIKLMQNYYCTIKTNNMQYHETFGCYATHEAII